MTAGTSETEQRSAGREDGTIDAQHQINEFVRLAEHELHAPLRIMLAFGERLEESCRGGLTSKQNEYLGRMLSSATRMQGIVEGLTHYSVVNSAGAEFEPLAIDELLRAVIRRFRTGRKHATPSTEGNGPSMPLIESELNAATPIRGDRKQLSFLFEELLTNACRFQPKDQTATVQVVGQQIEGGRYHVSIADNGIGISSERRSKATAMFVRFNGRGDYPGSGCGLAICRRIVERHGGHLELGDSKLGGLAVHLELGQSIQTPMDPTLPSSSR